MLSGNAAQVRSDRDQVRSDRETEEADTDPEYDSSYSNARGQFAGNSEVISTPCLVRLQVRRPSYHVQKTISSGSSYLVSTSVDVDMLLVRSVCSSTVSNITEGGTGSTNEDSGYMRLPVCCHYFLHFLVFGVPV